MLNKVKHGDLAHTSSAIAAIVSPVDRRVGTQGGGRLAKERRVFDLTRGYGFYLHIAHCVLGILILYGQQYY